MITRSAIDGRALVDLLNDKPRTQRRIHVELTKILSEHGVLILTGKNDERELFESIKKQTTDIRVMWVQAIKVLRSSARYRLVSPELDTPTSVLCDSNLPIEFCAQTDLIVVGSDVAERRGFNDTGYGREPGEPEQVTVDSVTHCQTIQRIQELKARGHYSEGTSRSVIWNEIFAPLAAASHEATLLDRYLLRGLTEQSNSLRHVEWLLDQLDEAMPNGSVVRILSEQPSSSLKASDFDSKMRRSVLNKRRKNIRSVQVVLSPWETMSNGRGPHDRHFRFSCGSAIGVEEGFDRLKVPKIWGLDGFTWKHFTHPETLRALAARERFVMAHEARVELLLM